AVAEDQPCNVCCEKSASTKGCGHPVGHHDKGQGEHRIEAFKLELEPIDEIDHRLAHTVSDEATHRHLLDKERDQDEGGQVWIQEEGDGPDGEEDRHRIVACRLEFE